MPIVIKDHVWKQTEQNIMIQVPLRGVHYSKADIFTSPRYIKVSFEHYFFETLLLHPVEISTSKCTKTPTNIIFELEKVEKQTWDTLEPQISKREKTKLKIKLIQEEHERIQKQHEQNVNKKAELKRIAVREQIELDAKKRETIEDIKKQEEKNALGDLEQWKKSVENKPNVTIQEKQITINPVSKKKKKNEVVPKLRSTRALQVEFTPREFPTPCRESKLDEENEFLRKQAAARRTAGFVSEDIRPEERNPQFLKAKGDEFMRNQNYIGAISAYSFGIKLCNKFVDLYIARSEAHLALGNYNSVINDCTDALELLKPALPVNRNERALCVGRRGYALSKFGMIKEGIGEMEASLKMKHDERFNEYLKEAKVALEMAKESEEIKKQESDEAEKKHE